MNHVDLFSGIGGFALAATWVWGEDYHNLGHSEIEKFPCKVYHKHFPESKCLGDITKIDWSEYAGRVDLLTGGFPCQPFSVAGKRKGKEDDRWLWHEMFRAVREAKPRWVIGENVAGIINVALDQVLSEMEGEGYTTETFIIPACAVNAPHRRDRVWIVAYSDPKSDRAGQLEIGNPRREGKVAQENRIGFWSESQRCDRTANNDGDGNTRTGSFAGKEYSSRLKGREETEASSSISGQDSKHSNAWNSNGTRLQGHREHGERAGERIIGQATWQESWYEVATRLCRVDDGVPNRVDKLKGLGNAISPQVVVPVMEAIKQSSNLETITKE